MAVTVTSQLAGADVTTTTTTEEFKLGTRLETDDGGVFVYAHALGAITANDVVLLDETWEADQLDTTNSATGFGQQVGVSRATFADNDYGWIQIAGVNDAINCGTGCVQNVAINSTATAGRIDDDATVGAEVITGLVITTTEVTGNTAPGYLNYPTIGATL